MRGFAYCWVYSDISQTCLTFVLRGRSIIMSVISSDAGLSDLYAAVRAEDDPRRGHALWRRGRDELFRSHPQSPLPPGDPLRTTGLPYWPYDPGLRFEVPLLAAEDDVSLLAKLRPANVDAAAGAVEEVARLVARIRVRWPRTRILLRADSGFARDDLMTWCEESGVDFLFGLAKNARLIAAITPELERAAAKSRRTGKPERRFKSFMWRTRTTWSRRRHVVAKAECTQGEANPRFVVTSLTRAQCKPKYLYERVYCARGDMENKIKECQLDLYADRTSAATMRANQLRLWFHSMAYACCCAPCAGSACATPPSPTPPAAPSVSSS